MNNNYSFDPVTVQPTNQQQPKKNNKIFIIMAILLVVGIIGGIFLLNNKDKEESINNENSSNSTDSVEETNNTYDKNSSFLMRIEDVFTITGRGTVVTGSVERGSIKLNDEVQIIGLNHDVITTTVAAIERFGEEPDKAEAGDNVAIFLKDVSRDQVKRGQVLAQPNTIKAIDKFEANVNVLSKEEGGRSTPFFNNYRPQFSFETAEITGTITLLDGVEMINPGDANVKITVNLTSNIAIEVGTYFSIREGGRIIATGTVTKIY